jgi:hypothetical protein
MNLAQLFTRARERRDAESYPQRVFLWLNHGENAEQRRAAEMAAGRIGPATQVTFVSWGGDEAMREG